MLVTLDSWQKILDNANIRKDWMFFKFGLSRCLKTILYSLVDLLECPTRYVHFIIYCDIEMLSRMFLIEFSPTLCLAIYGSAEYLLFAAYMFCFCIFNLRNKKDEFELGESFPIP